MKPKEIFEKLVKENKVCVLSTASSDGKPECAYMQYANDENNNIILKTFNDSRKYNNLKTNPRASIAIYNNPDYLQMDGDIQELEGEEKEAAKKLLKEQCGGRPESYKDPRMKYFLFKPNWIRVRLKDEYPYDFAEL